MGPRESVGDTDQHSAAKVASVSRAIFSFLFQKGVLIRMVITKEKAPCVRHQAYPTREVAEKKHLLPRRLFRICLLLRQGG